MKNKNLILLVGLAAVAVYFLMRKKTITQQTASTTDVPTPTPTPNPIKDKTLGDSLLQQEGGFGGVKPASLWTDEELRNFYIKNNCRTIKQLVKKTQFQLEREGTYYAEIAKRGLKFDCSGSADSNPQSQADCPEGTMFIRGVVSPCRPDTRCPRPRNYCKNVSKQPLARLLEQRIPTGIQ